MQIFLKYGGKLKISKNLKMIIGTAALSMCMAMTPSVNVNANKKPYMETVNINWDLRPDISLCAI